MPLRGLLVAGLAAALLAAPVPAASDPVAERNRAWLLEQVGGGYDPDRVYSGTIGLEPATLTGAEVLDRAVERMGDVDMLTLAEAAGMEAMHGPGDFWFIGFGAGSCGPNTVIAPSPLFIPLDPQLWVYSGGVGIFQASGFSGYWISWTLKESGTFGPEPLTYGPISDGFCFDGFLFFPYLTGWWWQ